MNGNSLREWRKNFNLTIGELAVMLNVSNKTIQRYELSRNKPLPVILIFAIKMLTIHLSLKRIEKMNKEEIIEIFLRK